tara:strand:+ start:401 stop:637 length:237 start_codon:yes stop_codon:yes gene_type:complete
LVEETINMEYEYGTHCGDTDCYSCATQRYNCKELDKKDEEAIVKAMKEYVPIIDEQEEAALWSTLDYEWEDEDFEDTK